ncbi:MAG: hypothetical protein ACTHKT_03450 [Solirubrobacterales bacterium]
MPAIILSAAATCFASLFLGQAALRLAGAREWSWLAPAVGISIAMMVATPTNHLPGRATTMFVLLALLSIAAAVWCLSSPAHRPGLRDLLAATPVAFLALLPFLAAGHAGTLGVSLNDDMAVHLVFVESYISAHAAAAVPLPKDYPLGPHAMAAVLTDGFGMRPEYAFAGWTMAAAVISAWTVLAAARRAPWFAKAIAATVVGFPFLLAAYYGQGAFKEVMQAGLVLAALLALSGFGPRLGRGRWVPLALIVGGIISVYEVTGLPWPVVFIALWLAGLLALAIWREGFGPAWRKAREAARAELPAIGIGLAVLVVFLLPQVSRMVAFLGRGGTGIPVSDPGNLLGRLPGWEALGVWNNQDFRMPAEPAFSGGLWAVFVLALVVIGTVWAFRRGRWLLPAAAAASVLIWAYSNHTQSPYVSAKGLVILSPLLLLLAMLPLIDRKAGERFPRSWLVVPLLGLVLFFKVGLSDERALRWSPVGPTDHAEELEEFRPILNGAQVLYVGPAEFARFELAGSPVNNVALGGSPYVLIRSRKEWKDGRAIDFDSLTAPTLNEFAWFVTTRDAAGSAPPAGLRPVKMTHSFVLWERVAEIHERSILREGEWPGAVFRCDTKEGREILAAGGVAAVRPLPRVAPVAKVPPGGSTSVQITLHRGAWELEMPYVSPQAIEVSSPVLTTTLPAYVDRPGQRWRLGRVVLDRSRQLMFTFKVEDNPFTSPIRPAELNNLIAVPVAPEKVIPVKRACGRYVDWYRNAGR